MTDYANMRDDTSSVASLSFAVKLPFADFSNTKRVCLEYAWSMPRLCLKYGYDHI